MAFKQNGSFMFAFIPSFTYFPRVSYLSIRYMLGLVIILKFPLFYARNLILSHTLMTFFFTTIAHISLTCIHLGQASLHPLIISNFD